MDEEVKKLLAELIKTFVAFKAANDQAQAEIKKLGAADTVTAEQVKKLNEALDAIGAELKKTNAQQDELVKRVERPGGGEPAPNAAEHKALKEFNQTIRLAAQRRGSAAPDALDLAGFRAYKSAFESYARKGPNEVWSDAERKALSVGSDADGGFLVPSDTTGRITAKIYETSAVRQVASVQAISTDALEGINDLDQAGAGWVAETGARAATSAPQVGKWRIPVYEMYAMPEATQQLLDDAAIDIEAWLADKVAGKLMRTEETAFVTGSGVGKPRGFASYTTAATADGSRAWGTPEHVATGTSGGFGTAPNGSDKLIDLVHKLKAGYRPGSVWAMNKGTLGTTRQLKANNDYIWLPSMLSGQPSTLLGYPVMEFEDMAAIAADSLSIAFGNFKEGYQIVDRIGLRTLRDPFTNKPYVRFYTTRRVGGDVLNFESLKFLKFGTS
jgi:HK97 family phage major capsid protein